MANPEHVAIFNEGVEAWNAWRKANQKVKCDLSGEDLRGENPDKRRNLHGIYLNKANLKGVNLTNANLSRAWLFSANLSGATLNSAILTAAHLIAANFTGAKLVNAGFSDTSLNGVSFLDADLTGVNFSQARFYAAYLKNTNLENAVFDSTIFYNMNLSEAINLEKSIHRSPSVVNNKTLKFSSPLPEIFLKGIGLYDWEIEQAKIYQRYLSREDAEAIQREILRLRFESLFPHHTDSQVFISYAHKDSEFVDKLHTALDANGVRCWRDVKDLPDAPAGPLDQVLVKGMQDRVILVVLSENSITSEWVHYELESAISMGIEEGRVTLLPITLDNYFLEYNWSPKIKSKVLGNNIPNFSQWSDQSVFEKCLKQVLQGLDLYYQTD